MKKIFALSLFAIIAITLSAQETETESGSVTKLKKADRVVLDLFYDTWQGLPSGIEPGLLQPGIGITSFQDYPIGNSNFAFAFGVGISVHNFYSNAFIAMDTNNVTQLLPLSTDLEYKVNKLTLTYLETPIEFRYRTKGVYTFRFYAGFKLGYLLQEHTKYSGDDPFSDGQIKYKEYKHKNFNNLRYGPTVRIGYRWFNLYASYNMTTLFKEDKGPQMYPISIGLMISPY